MNWKIALTGLVVTGMAAGCTTAQKGAAVGAGVGGGAAYVVGTQSATITHPTEAIPVGALAGAAAGALIGDALDETKGRGNEDTSKLKTDNMSLQAIASDKAAAAARAQAEADRLAAENARLAAELAKKSNAVQVTQENGQIRFTILNEVLFDSGKADLKPEGVTVVDSVLDLIQKDFADRKIMIEGHTDNQPIVHSTWKNNRALSYARAAAVLEHFSGDKGIPGERLSALACGEYRPVAGNDTKDGQRQNRRAVIVVLPADSNIVVDHAK